MRRRSRFTVQAFATGILSAMGHNPTIGIRTFSGEVEFNAGRSRSRRFPPHDSSHHRLAVQDDISDKDRREIERVMNSEVLEIDEVSGDPLRSSAISVTKIDGISVFCDAERQT